MSETSAINDDAIEAFEFIDKYDRVALRNCMVVAFFFDKPPEQITSSIASVLAAYIAAIPPHALTYAATHAAQDGLKPFNRRTIAACRKHLTIGAARRSLTAIHLDCSGGKASQYEFDFLGQRPYADAPESVSVLTMHFPINVITRNRVERFCSTLRAISESLDYLYGYCSPAVVTMSGGLGSMPQKELRRLALRYPGYDLPDNHGTALALGRRVRGARWISWLGPELAAVLGGLAVLKKALPKPIALEALSKGLMIRAGTVPELGDLDRHIDTPILRKVARVLEPVTLFDDLFTKIYPNSGDKELLRRWERRFLD